jgi:beta-glucosidase
MNEPTSGTFRDPGLPLDARLADLLGRLSLEEKVGLLHQYQAPVERLGLAGFRTGTEALHGLAWLGPATVFPQAIGLASTWNPELVRRVGAATGDEVLAFHHKDPSGAGRNVWAPVVNPLRDPRWGRNEEGYSEDPWLTGVMATAYASGLRGDHPTVLKTAPTLKHFLGYNNETDRCTSSSNLPPRVLHEYELPAYRAPLEAGAAVAVMPSYNLVNGRPAHLSPLIDRVLRDWAPGDLLVVSDAYAPANLTGLQGYHEDLPEAYAHAIKAGLDSFTQDDDRPEATLGHIREALRRGLLAEADIDRAVRHALSIRLRLGEFDPGTPFDDVTEEVVNRPEHQTLAREAARQAFVLLKNDGILPLSAIGAAIGADGAEAPGEGAGTPVRTVAVIGQLGDKLMEDWYSGTLPYTVTALTGVSARCATVFCEGVDRVALTLDGRPVAAGEDLGGGPLGVRPVTEPRATWFDLFDWGGGAYALRAAANGRYVSVDEDGVLVNDQPGPNGWEVRQTFRLEERPRGALVLRHIATGRYVGPVAGVLRLVDDADAAAVLTPELVVSGAEAAARAAREADVAIVVAGDHPLVNGRETEDRSDLALPAAQESVLRAVHAANPRTVLVLSSGYPFTVTWADENLPAVLWSAHGGQEYGHALADVLFGDEDPGGRLTQTWYRSECELPDLFDYDIIAADATYLYYRGTPLYPFGHGLSYTTFGYDDLTVAVAGDRLAAAVTVTNTGPRPGVEVVQFYSRQQRSRMKQPLRRLRGFTRMRLAPGESRRVALDIPLSELACWDVTRGRFVVEDAPHKIMVGRSARDVRLCAPVHVPGEPIPPRDALARPIAAADNDEYDGVTLVDAAKEDGDAVRSGEEGAWIRFREVDFGVGAGSCVLTVAGAEGGVVTLRLGDPLFGEVVATAPVPRTAHHHDLADVSCALAGVAGVHDLYVVFENEGLTLRTLTFSPALPQSVSGSVSGPFPGAAR